MARPRTLLFDSLYSTRQETLGGEAHCVIPEGQLDDVESVALAELSIESRHSFVTPDNNSLYCALLVFRKTDVASGEKFSKSSPLPAASLNPYVVRAFVARIPTGSYTGTGLAAAVVTAVDAAYVAAYPNLGTIGLTCTYSETTNKFSFGTTVQDNRLDLSSGGTYINALHIFPAHKTLAINYTEQHWEGYLRQSSDLIRQHGTADQATYDYDILLSSTNNMNKILGVVDCSVKNTADEPWRDEFNYPALWLSYKKVTQGQTSGTLMANPIQNSSTTAQISGIMGSPYLYVTCSLVNSSMICSTLPQRPDVIARLNLGSVPTGPFTIIPSVSEVSFKDTTSPRIKNFVISLVDPHTGRPVGHSHFSGVLLVKYIDE